MSAHTMTGLEIMQAYVAGTIPIASIAKTIPMQPMHAEKGKVTFYATADENHLNPLGGVHGGFISTVMDSVTGCAVHTMLDACVGYGTVDLNVKMLRPVPQNVRLIAEGKIVHVSNSIAVSEGSLKDEDGKLYAHSTATCMILRPKAKS